MEAEGAGVVVEVPRAQPAAAQRRQAEQCSARPFEQLGGELPREVRKREEYRVQRFAREPVVAARGRDVGEAAGRERELEPVEVAVAARLEPMLAEEEEFRVSGRLEREPAS